MKLRLLERFNELGWATTCRCDILAQWTGSNQLQARFAFLFSLSFFLVPLVRWAADGRQFDSLFPVLSV